jgi:hypothetical protein
MISICQALSFNFVNPLYSSSHTMLTASKKSKKIRKFGLQGNRVHAKMQID